MAVLRFQTIQNRLRQISNVEWALLILALVVGSITVQNGQWYFPDEFRYFIGGNVWMLQTWDQVPPDVVGPRTLQFMPEALRSPLYHVLYLPATLTQWAASGFQFHVDPASGWAENYQWNIIPGLYNVLWYLFNGILLYRVSLKLFSHQTVARVTWLFYILWLPHLIFTRHMFPCIPAETFLLLSVWLLIKGIQHPPGNNLTGYKLFLWAGIAWIIHFLIYLGYYYTLIPIIAIAAWWPGQKPTPPQRLKAAGMLLAPLALGMLVMETFCQFGLSMSFVTYLMELSQHINHGAFAEGWRLPWDYALAVGPVFGLILAGCTLAGAAYPWLNREDPNRWQVGVTIWIFILMWIIHTVNSVLLHKFVVYGRTVFPTFDWLLLPAAYVLAKNLPNNFQKLSPTALWSTITITLCVISMGTSIADFWSQTYPRDMGQVFTYQTGIPIQNGFLHSSRSKDFSLTPAGPEGAPMVLETRSMNSKDPNTVPLGCESIAPFLKPNQPLFLLINRTHFNPVHHQNPIDPKLLHSGKLLMSARHPLGALFYQYEGLGPQQRQAIRKQPFNMLALENPCRNMDNIKLRRKKPPSR
ncbi:MAG: hypothetical protein KTR14_03620 [Vampirovibrio sp.]|nr:hypothetical protein [Vampirovibrio sp.]